MKPRIYRSPTTGRWVLFAIIYGQNLPVRVAESWQQAVDFLREGYIAGTVRR